MHSALATIGMPNLSSTIVSGEELAGANVTKLHPKSYKGNEEKPGVVEIFSKNVLPFVITRLALED